MANPLLDNKKCESKAEILLVELVASKKAYGSFIQADIYPHKRDYFDKSYKQRNGFSTILREEFTVIGYTNRSVSSGYNNGIFEAMENQVLEGNLTDRQLNELIADKEQELLFLYQDMLVCRLPNLTAALLQYQAEQLNNGLHLLKLDLRIAKGKANNPVLI